MAALSFNAANVEPDQGRIGAIPAGWYPVSVDESELKPTADTMGAYLNVRFSVLDGPYKGSKFWHRFNTRNNNEKTVEIGYKQLSALMHAVRVLNMQDSAQLHNIPLFVKAKIKPAEGQYDASNEITAFRDISDAAAKQGFQGALAGGASAATKAVVIPPAQTATPAAPGAPAAGWTPPAVQQPWTQQAAPAVQTTLPASAQVPPPAETAPAVAQPAPSWASAPAQAVQAAAQVVQAAAIVAATQDTSCEAPATQEQVGETLPPWMQ